MTATALPTSTQNETLAPPRPTMVWHFTEEGQFEGLGWTVND